MFSLSKLKRYYNWGGRFLTNQHFVNGANKTKIEISKTPLRTEIINFLVASFQREVKYLEIGVRNPDHNFNKIDAQIKYSVDPGVEFKENPVDFKLTSDAFFKKLKKGEILDSSIKFDIIFIDGLHLADQVYKDIENALNYISEDGFIVLHDCNPPTEWHAREAYDYDLTPARQYWNGTTWKAFVKAGERSDCYSCCIDSDWGVGIISKKINFGATEIVLNPYFEFHVFDENRVASLNLLSYDTFKELLHK